MNNIYTVNELVYFLSTHFKNEIEFNNIKIRGEITNLKVGTYLNFSMKEKFYDKYNFINLVSFENYKNLNIKNGDIVEVIGDVRFYGRSGDLKIQVSSIKELNDEGYFKKKIEEYKKLCDLKGYFLPERKKPIPKLIKRIGIVTSREGAVIHDMYDTLQKKDKNVDIYIYSVKVQGYNSGKEIGEGIKYFNKYQEKYNLDAIIIGRGGGSNEDLLAFSSEDVVEAIYESNIFICSAVGHNIDSNISDMVADLTVSTPTQAIMQLIKREEYENSLKNYKQRSSSLLELKLNKLKLKFFEYKNSESLMKFKNIFKDKLNMLGNIKYKLKFNIENKILNAKKELETNKQILYKINLDNKLLENKTKLIKIEKDLCKNMNQRLVYSKNKLEKLLLIIDKYSIKDILKRGYTLIRENGKIVKSKNLIEKNKNIEIEFIDGKIEAITK